MTTVRSNGVSLDEQAEFNQKRIAVLEQECEHSSAQFELEMPSHARNKFALDRLNDAWERLSALFYILHWLVVAGAICAAIYLRMQTPELEELISWILAALKRCSTLM